MQGALPSLLATDIVESTRSWAQHDAVMADGLVTFDEFVRAAIRAAGGRIFKPTGDGMMARFETEPRRRSAVTDCHI
jgi:class 3 adenylate cyclase